MQGLKFHLLLIPLVWAWHFHTMLHFFPFRMVMHILCHIMLEGLKRLPGVFKDTLNLGLLVIVEAVTEYGDF